MSTPFFSVVIPAYNRAHILPKTIESVNNQTFKDYEIIVVDDGSTDTTRQVISNLNNPKLTYIYQQNAERSAARNNGARNALGKYICFLDSDDFYLENHLEILYSEIQKNKFDVALYFVNCNLLQKDKITKPIIEPLVGNVFSYFLFNSVVPARVCIQKQVFSTFAFIEDIVIVEDTVMWCNVATKFPVHHIQENTVLYPLHDDNSILIEKNCFLPRLKGLLKMFAQPQMKGVINTTVKREVISDCYFGIARHYEFTHRFMPMLWYSLLSFSYTPFSKTSKKKIYMIYAYIFGKPSNNY